ncbi:MAG: hypothetical protein KDB03_13205 [Planctomycetales bacterium]|nr:hypothetical protein [Planctomycetales bacterium]
MVVLLISKPARNLWERTLALLTLSLTWLVTWITLGTFYFLVITPLGILLRLFKYDPLGLSSTTRDIPSSACEGESKSYFQPATPVAQENPLRPF